MTRPIDTLLFDFGGTLDADGVAWKERFHDHYRAEGLDVAAEAFAPVFYAADDPLVGGLPEDADLAATVARLTDNLESELGRRGIARRDAARGGRVAARFLADAEAAFRRNRPLLEALGARYRLGIVSNFYGNLDAVCRGAGLKPLFGAIADSERVGAEKPDPAIFHAALHPLGAEAATTLFIGDSLRRDRAGARALGMGFIWLAPVEAQAAETDRDHPVVARLDALRELLA
ncbi:MAG: HAD family hydrolase [Candidatus Eiseniibacteriota bacterium]